MANFIRNNFEEIKITFPVKNVGQLATMTSVDLKETFSYIFRIGALLNFSSDWEFFLKDVDGKIIPTILRTSETFRDVANLFVEAKVRLDLYGDSVAKDSITDEVNVNVAYEYKLPSFSTKHRLSFFKKQEGLLTLRFRVGEMLSPAIYGDPNAARVMSPIQRIEGSSKTGDDKRDSDLVVESSAEQQLKPPSEGQLVPQKATTAHNPLAGHNADEENKSDSQTTFHENQIEDEHNLQLKKLEENARLIYNSKGQVDCVLDTQRNDEDDEDNSKQLGSKLPPANAQVQNNNVCNILNATGSRYGNVTTTGEQLLQIKNRYIVDRCSMQFLVSDLKSFSELDQEQLLQLYAKEFEIGEVNDCPTLWKLVFLKHGEVISAALKLLESKTQDVEDLKVDAAFAFTCGEGKVLWKSNTVIKQEGLFSFPNGVSIHDLASNGNSKATCTLRVQVGIKYDPTTGHSFTSRAQRTKKLKQDLEDLSDNFSDANFCVIPCDGNSQLDTIFVHEAIITARCPALKQETAKKGSDFNSQIPTVRLEFLSKACLYIFVKYLYTSEVDDNWKRYPVELLQAAHRYNLPELLQYCRRHIKEAETTNNRNEICKVFDKIDDNVNFNL